MPSDEMPERIWVRANGDWLSNPCYGGEGIEYRRSDLCASGQQVRALMEAARELIDGASSTYRARNNRKVGIEADDGEMCYIVHSDLMHALETALTPAPQPDGEAVPKCVACEDSPKPPNVPCAVCGAHPPQPSEMVAEECPASGQAHNFTPHGPNGEVQCEYCGAPQPSETVADTDAIAKAIAFSGEIKERRGWDDLLPETRKLYRDKATAALHALKGVEANG